MSVHSIPYFCYIIIQEFRDILSKLNKLIEQFQLRLKRYAYVLTRNIEDAEDLFSQVCIKIIEKYDNSIVHFYSWAKTITYNTHLDNVRKKYIKQSKGEKFRISELEYDNFYDYDDDGKKLGQSSVKKAQAAEDLKRLSKVISEEDRYYMDRYQITMNLILELPLIQREVLMLHVDGDSYNQIAEKLSLAKGTVMSTLCRAREKLTKLLMESEENEQLD